MNERDYRSRQPYAVSLLRRFKAGETVAELAAAEGIPIDRIAMRVRAAQLVEQMRSQGSNGGDLQILCVHVPAVRKPLGELLRTDDNSMKP